MKQFRNVLKFEYMTVVKNKTFIVTTTIFLLLIIIASFIPSIAGVVGNLFSGGEEKSAEVKTAFVQETDLRCDDAVLAVYLGDYKFERGTITDDVKSKVESKEYDFAVSFSQSGFTLYTGSSVSFESGPADKIYAMIYQTRQSMYLSDKGLTSEDIAGYKAIEVQSEVITLGKSFEYTFWYAYFLLFMLYITILMYGQLVVTSVATEKSTKTMELLITSAKPSTLLFGKVIGTGLAGLTQFLLILLATGASLSFNLNSWLGVSEGIGAAISFALSSDLFIYAIVFFVIGFFQFAFVYAAFGSTITRLEEANSVVIFPMFLFMAAFLTAFLGMTAGATAGYITVLSYVPFFSPLVMFMRMCVTDVTLIETIIAIAINLAALFAVGILSGRIYKTGVMLYGNPPKLGTIFKYMIKG